MSWFDEQIKERLKNDNDGWYKKCIGAILEKTKERDIAALIPGKLIGYIFFDHETGRRAKLTFSVVMVFPHQYQADGQPLAPGCRAAGADPRHAEMR